MVSPVADVSTLRAALSAVLGVRGVVLKRRELLIWQNVRIHLDDVESLGSFLEFEAVLDVTAPDPAAEEATSHERLRLLCRELEIDPADTIAGSYSDMTG